LEEYCYYCGTILYQEANTSLCMGCSYYKIYSASHLLSDGVRLHKPYLGVYFVELIYGIDFIVLKLFGKDFEALDCEANSVKIINGNQPKNKNDLKKLIKRAVRLVSIS